MLVYQEGRTFPHRLDPRSKLLFQFGFALAAVLTESWLALAALTGVALGTVVVARLSPVRVLWNYRFILFILALAPVFASLRFGSPWIDTARGFDSLVAGYRILLVLLVAGVYVRTTPIRASRAAVQRHVPGRPGQLLGVGIALVFRFFPVLLSDVRHARLAIEARAGTELSTVERLWRLALMGLRRAFERAETLSLALRARCFAWNPTLPALRLSWYDYPVLVCGLALSLSPLFV